MTQSADKPKDKPGGELGFERLVNFSDAIFSVAITLMALEIRLPELDPAHAAEQINAAILSLAPHIFVYILSFVVIGIYWVLHRRLFGIIKSYNFRLIWLNLIFLMFIAFVPVTTNALGTYPNLPIVSALYALSLVLVGVSEWVLWWYASLRHYLRPLNAPRTRLYISLRILTPPAVFLLSLLLAPFSALLMQLSWALMIPIFYILRFIFPREHAERATFERGEV